MALVMIITLLELTAQVKHRFLGSLIFQSGQTFFHHFRIDITTHGNNSSKGCCLTVNYSFLTKLAQWALKYQFSGLSLTELMIRGIYHVKDLLTVTLNTGKERPQTALRDYDRWEWGQLHMLTMTHKYPT